MAHQWHPLAHERNLNSKCKLKQHTIQDPRGPEKYNYYINTQLPTLLMVKPMVKLSLPFSTRLSFCSRDTSTSSSSSSMSNMYWNYKHSPSLMSNMYWNYKHSPFSISNMYWNYNHPSYSMSNMYWNYKHPPSSMSNMYWNYKHSPYSMSNMY